MAQDSASASSYALLVADKHRGNLCRSLRRLWKWILSSRCCFSDITYEFRIKTKSQWGPLLLCESDVHGTDIHNDKSFLQNIKYVIKCGSNVTFGNFHLVWDPMLDKSRSPLASSGSSVWGIYRIYRKKHKSWKFMKFMYEVQKYSKQLSTLHFAKIFSAVQALPPHSSHKVDPPNEEGTCQFQLYMNLIQYGGLGMTKGKRKKILFFLIPLSNCHYREEEEGELPTWFLKKKSSVFLSPCRPPLNCLAFAHQPWNLVYWLVLCRASLRSYIHSGGRHRSDRFNGNSRYQKPSLWWHLGFDHLCATENILCAKDCSEKDPRGMLQTISLDIFIHLGTIFVDKTDKYLVIDDAKVSWTTKNTKELLQYKTPACRIWKIIIYMNTNS